VLLSDLYSIANAESGKPSAALIDFRKRMIFSNLIERFEGLQSEYTFEHIPCVQVRAALSASSSPLSTSTSHRIFCSSHPMSGTPP